MKTILALLVSVPLIATAQTRGVAAANSNDTPAPRNHAQVQSSAAATQPPVCGYCGRVLPAGARLAQRGGPGMRVGHMGVRVSYCTLTVTSGAVTTLTAEQMVAAIELERAAYDLYTAATAKWSLGVFGRITAAEVRHAASLTQLATSSGITVPPAVVGSYATPDVQALYAAVLPLINESETAALGAGAFVEETVISSLRALLATDLDETTRTILTHLESASRSHLIAFVDNLAAQGITYEPKVLSAEDYADIIGG